MKSAFIICLFGLLFCKPSIASELESTSLQQPVKFIGASIGHHCVERGSGLRNRILIVAIDTYYKRGGPQNIETVEWSGQSLTYLTGIGGSKVETELWFLNEQGISSGSGGNDDVKINQNGKYIDRIISCAWAKNVDQVKPILGWAVQFNKSDHGEISMPKSKHGLSLCTGVWSHLKGGTSVIEEVGKDWHVAAQNPSFFLTSWLGHSIGNSKKLDTCRLVDKNGYGGNNMTIIQLRQIR